MSQPVEIRSHDQFNSLLKSSTVVVADFYANWCGPCKAIAPLYAQLSVQLSRPKKITFAKVNTDEATSVAQHYGVTAMPTFIIFKSAQQVDMIKGADPAKLQAAIKKLAAEADGAEGYGSVGGAESWLGIAPPQGYGDVTDQVDVRGLDLLNANSDFGGARTLFQSSQPEGLEAGKGKSKATSSVGEGKDWIQSDTDEQLMLYAPLQATIKVHSLHITSLPQQADGDDEISMRPKTIKLYTNRPNILGFDEAEDITETQEFTLKPSDWNPKTGTAALSLRFVKFQAVYSLVVFVVDGEGEGESVRVDRLRIFGEVGEKRDQGKIEKIEHD